MYRGWMENRWLYNLHAESDSFCWDSISLNKQPLRSHPMHMHKNQEANEVH